MHSDSIAERQAVLVAALLDPGRYPHPVTTVERLETHISYILLAGAYAYKIKKPLDLGFLDFTGLERRKFYCHEEVRLNRRLAPEVYLDCIPICGSAENPRLNGDPAQAVEYAVKMRRFAQEDLLERRLAAGRLAPHYIDLLARRVADFHGSIARAGSRDPFGSPARVHQPALDNFAQLRPLLSAAQDLTLLAQLEDWTRETSQRLQPVLLERKAGGFIRECHGDLHLGNIVLENGRMVIFDGIEFNEDLRWIDVMSDLGFLTMDLHRHRAAALAWRLLNVYLEHSGDYGGLAVLPYYQVYRALVRAKIAAIRRHQPTLCAAERAQAEQDCRSYLTLALGFVQGPPPFLLITHGVSGSGKSTLTGRLLETLGGIRIRSDVERKRLFGLGPLDASRSALDGGIYTAAAGRRTYERLRRLAGQVLTARYPVLVDATFLEPAERQVFQALAGALKVPFILLVCTADPKTLQDRLARRQAEGNDAAEADAAVLERQLRHYSPPGPEEDPLEAGTGAVEPLAAAVLARLHRHNPAEQH